MTDASQGEAAAYHPLLDSLRALAILLVLVEHWLYPLGRSIGLHGSYGVWLFFTLSGYLITGILLRYREAVRDGRATVKHALSIFFARRFLRIMPAYYLFLGISSLAGILNSDNALWHLLYLSNFYFMYEGQLKAMGHLWSLSVEEQFYLVWPAIILVVTKRGLPLAIACCIAGAIVFRVISLWQGWPLAYYVFPIACLDTLGLGALLAWLNWQSSPMFRTSLRWAQYAGLAAAPVVGFAPEAIFNAIAPLIIGLASTWLIEVAVRGVPDIVGRILAWAPVLYAGRLSYGLYLYHGLASRFVDARFVQMLPDGYYGAMLLAAALKGIVLLLIVTVSWYLFELPINRLKRYFSLVDRDGKIEAQAPG